MNINAHARALQHLLVQGFTLYTCPAAICVRMCAPLVLEAHTWACYFVDSGAIDWCSRLDEADPWRAVMMEAAEGATPKTPLVLCHFDAMFLALPLQVDEVRHAKARLEVAKNLDVEPPSLEGVRAIPDDVLELELKRRKREARKAEPEAPSDPN
jgi:hypothetical protein